MEIKVSERCHGTTLRRGANTRCKHTTNRSTLCHQHLKVDKSLRIKELSKNSIKSGISGRTKYGLFTTGFIPVGGRICYWTGEILEQNPDSKFALQILKKPQTWVDASKSNTGEARYARACLSENNKCENNAVLKHSKKTNQTYLEASRDINAGEEILTEPQVKLSKKEKVDIPEIKIPKPRRRIRIVELDEPEEPKEEDLPQGFNLDEEPEIERPAILDGSPIRRLGAPTPPRIQPKAKASRGEPLVNPVHRIPKDPVLNHRKKRNHLEANKKREELYELKILKRLLLIQTLFRDSKLAQKNLTRPKPNYKIVPADDGDLEKLDKLLNKEEKALLQLYKSGGQNKTMTLGDLQKELDALGKKRKRG